jgi:hypothetical protein
MHEQKNHHADNPKDDHDAGQPAKQIASHSIFYLLLCAAGCGGAQRKRGG